MVGADGLMVGIALSDDRGRRATGDETMNFCGCVVMTQPRSFSAAAAVAAAPRTSWEQATTNEHNTVCSCPPWVQR